MQNLHPLIISILVALSSADLAKSQSYPRMIPVAALFRNSEEADLQRAYREALYFHNTNNATQLLFTIDETERVMKSDTYDVWEVMQMICAVAKKGYFYLMGSGDNYVHDAFSSVSQKLNLPFINWALPPTEKLTYYEVSLKPPLTKVIADIIEAKGWTNISYIYDDPEGLKHLEILSDYLMETKSVSLITNLKQLPDTHDVEILNQFFFNFHESRNSHDNHVILDVTNRRKLNQTLRSLQEVAIKSRHFHYLIASLEVTEEDIAEFRVGVVNVTGLKLVNRDSYEFWKFMQKWRHLESHQGGEPSTGEVSVDAALAYDSINVAVNAITKLMYEHSGRFNHTFKRDELWNYDYPGVYCFPSEDKANPNRPFLPMENGELLAKFLRNVVTVGLTGHIEFDENGFRKGYQLEILELLYFGDNVAHSIETKSKWIDGVSFVQGSEITSRSTAKPVQEESSENKELVITTVISKPFVMEKTLINTKEKLQGNERYEGYCVDLMHLVAQNLSRKFRIQVVKDKKYGNVGPNGRWDGMVGELLRGEADMAVAPLTINRQRERVVDFTKPFMTTGISIMIKKPDKQEFSVFSFMQPLSSDVWMYIIFAYIGVSIMIFLVARFSPYEWRVDENSNGNLVVSNDFSLYNCLWFTLAAFMQQGTDILPRSVSGRIASSAWWFFTMIIVSSYTANLAAFLTLEKMHAPIGSAEDLAKQSKIKYGIQENGSTATFFKESTVNIYQRMWSYMAKEKNVLVKDYDDGITKVRESKGRYAFLLEATSNEYANTRKPCDTMKVGENLNSLGYGVATKFGSPLKSGDPPFVFRAKQKRAFFRTRINLIVLELLERGELKKLENRWWYEKSQCEQGMTDSQSASLTLSKVAGIFYILIGGMVLAMAAALGEFIYRSKVDSIRNKRDLTGMMQTRLSIPYKPKNENGGTEKVIEPIWNKD